MQTPPELPKGGCPGGLLGAEDPDAIMNYYKVLPCQRTRRSHDWSKCPFAHPGEKVARRDLRTHAYQSVMCPHAREVGGCPRGDACVYAHNVFECWLHPDRYRTQLCAFGTNCTRPLCFFVHGVEQLRTPSAPAPLPPEGGADARWGSPPNTAAAPPPGSPASQPYRVAYSSSSSSSGGNSVPLHSATTADFIAALSNCGALEPACAQPQLLGVGCAAQPCDANAPLWHSSPARATFEQAPLALLQVTPSQSAEGNAWAAAAIMRGDMHVHQSNPANAHVVCDSTRLADAFVQELVATATTQAREASFQQQQQQQQQQQLRQRQQLLMSEQANTIEALASLLNAALSRQGLGR